MVSNLTGISYNILKNNKFTHSETNLNQQT